MSYLLEWSVETQTMDKELIGVLAKEVEPLIPQTINNKKARQFLVGLVPGVNYDYY